MESTSFPSTFTSQRTSHISQLQRGEVSDCGVLKHRAEQPSLDCRSRIERVPTDNSVYKAQESAGNIYGEAGITSQWNTCHDSGRLGRSEPPASTNHSPPSSNSPPPPSPPPCRNESDEYDGVPSSVKNHQPTGIHTDHKSSQSQAGYSITEFLGQHLSVKRKKQMTLKYAAKTEVLCGTSGSIGSGSNVLGRNQAIQRKPDRDRTPFFEECIHATFKKVSLIDIKQYREGMKSITYELPTNILELLKTWSFEETTKYITALHKDNTYVSDLAVEARTTQQRLAAENEFLRQKVEDLEHKLSMTQSLYTAKLKS